VSVRKNSWSRLPAKSNRLFSVRRPYFFSKIFYENSSVNFLVILLTDKQTNRQTEQRRRKHHFTLLRVEHMANIPNTCTCHNYFTVAVTWREKVGNHCWKGYFSRAAPQKLWHYSRFDAIVSKRTNIMGNVIKYAWQTRNNSKI